MDSTNWFKIMSLGGILNFFMPMSIAINPNCDFYQYMEKGQEYYIYNYDYPGNYHGEQSCRWIAHSPESTRIVLSCEDINLPASRNCEEDRLIVSVNGDISTNNGHRYCGTGSFSRVSDGNALSVILSAPRSTKGGRFLCTLTAISVNPPTTTTTISTPITSCNCGWKSQTRIVGGVDTTPNEYPSMAALLNLQERRVFCGASIISDRYALTAAHCLDNIRPQNVALLVGDQTLSLGNDTNYAALYIVTQFIVYNGYNSITDQGDIAIVKTRDEIKFSLYVGPICLPFRYTFDTFVGDIVTALGWGLLEFSGTPADTLQKVNLTIVSNDVCSQAITNQPITDSQICTYTPDKDTCTGDSGGPLLWQDENSKRLHLVGIVSFGAVCASQSPAVNTRVTTYLSWVVSQTPDTVYCIK